MERFGNRDSEQFTDSNGRADTRLTILNLEVGKKNREYILRTDCLGNVTERVYSSSSDSSLVSFEEIE